MLRRALLAAAAAAPIAAPAKAIEVVRPVGPRPLADGPITLRGDWGGVPPESVLAVLNRVRAISLAPLRLLSDRQPAGLIVEARNSGPPMIWVIAEQHRYAWIVLDARPWDWSQIAYEFGHELGHVLCNTWGPNGLSPNPCRWMEEALVEAFSIRNLARLADSWDNDPPVRTEPGFSATIRRYRGWQLDPDMKAAAATGADRDMAAWFRARRPDLEVHAGVTDGAREAVPAFLAQMNADPTCLEGLGAFSRWPERTGVPMPEFMDRWERSCLEIGASPWLPRRIRALLEV
jgi:hypothetical protein